MANHDHGGHRIRMRKRYFQEGLDGFADHEVLEMLLYYCYPRGDTNARAHQMLKKFGTLHNLFEADVETLKEVLGCSENIAVLLNFVPKLSNRYFRSKWGNIIIIDDEKIAGKYAIDLFVGEVVEKFYVLCLDKKFRLINTVAISEGTTDEAAVYLREIINAALKNNATAIILAHNHPGGLAKPSKSDIEATRQIVKNMEAINIDVLDHVISAGDTYYSFAARRQHVRGYF
jgi:DNA repair protein RadC